MSTLTIEATGLGVLHPDHRKDLEMIMRFIMEKNHTFRIITKRLHPITGEIPESTREYRLGLRPVEIGFDFHYLNGEDFSVEDGTEQDLAGLIVDLNELHGNTRLKDVPSSTKTPVSILTIPTARPYSAKLTSKPYEIWTYEKTTSPTVKPPTQTYKYQKNVTQSIGAKFEIPTNRQATVTVSGEESFSLIFPSVKNVNYLIEFNNDCDHAKEKDGDCGDDFHLFYHLLDGTFERVEHGTTVRGIINVRENVYHGTSGTTDILACNPPQGGGGS